MYKIIWSQTPKSFYQIVILRHLGYTLLMNLPSILLLEYTLFFLFVFFSVFSLTSIQPRHCKPNNGRALAGLDYSLIQIVMPDCLAGHSYGQRLAEPKARLLRQRPGRLAFQPASQKARPSTGWRGVAGRGRGLWPDVRLKVGVNWKRRKRRKKRTPDVAQPWLGSS